MLIGLTALLISPLALRLAAPLSTTPPVLSHYRRCGHCIAAEGDAADPDDIMAELRKALSDVDPVERADLDARSLDGFVADKQGQVSAFEEGFAKELESVQESLEAKLESKLSGVQSDFLSRIDAAVDELRKDAPVDPNAAAKAAAAAAGAAMIDGVPSAELPPGSLVVVAGASNKLGAMLVKALDGSGSGWKLRALVNEGGKGPDVSANGACECVPFAPFAPTKLSRSLGGASALVVVSQGAGGDGGLEPEVIPKLMKACGPGLRRVIMVSQHGVERADKLPFSMGNLFGQLDKQRAAEQELVLASRKLNLPCFSILRVGKLKDDGNAVSAAAYKEPPKSRAELAAGDALSGELPMSTAAGVLVQSLIRSEAVNATFSLGAPEGKGVTSGLSSDEAHWDDQFLKLVGPEVYRKPLPPKLPVFETQEWLREWARRFLRPGQQLTTPVAVQDVDDGVLLRFLTRATGYADFDAEETNDQKWAATKPGAMEAKAGKPDGALLLVAEGQPKPRVRVMRAEMDGGVVVKEMSETAVLERLERDLVELEKKFV